MLEGQAAQTCGEKFTWDLNNLSVLDSLSYGNDNSESQVLTFHKFVDDSNESGKKENAEESNQLYLIRSMDHKRNFPASGYSYCDAINDTLKKMLQEEVTGETLSSFLGNVAGVPVNVEEMVKEVQQGSKSYENDVDEKQSLRGLLKRPVMAPPALMPLDRKQIQGFQLLSNEDTPNYNNTRYTSDSDDGLYECLAREKLESEQNKRKRRKRKIVVTFQKTEENLWGPKKEPQKIVPIYSEQVSGLRVFRKRHRRHRINGHSMAATII